MALPKAGLGFWRRRCLTGAGRRGSRHVRAAVPMNRFHAPAESLSPESQRRHGFRPKAPCQLLPGSWSMPWRSVPTGGTHLNGGWVQRTEEVIELPVAPVPGDRARPGSPHLSGMPAAPAGPKRPFAGGGFRWASSASGPGQSGKPDGDPAGGSRLPIRIIAGTWRPSIQLHPLPSQARPWSSPSG